MAGEIERITAERIRAELDKLILGDFPVDGIEMLCDTGLAQHVLPEIPAMELEIDEHHQHKDVYRHSLTVLQQAIDLEDGDPDLILRWAALLHDIGKPATKRNEPGGGVSFHHHEVVGAKLVRKRMRALKYPKQVIDDVAATGVPASAVPRVRQGSVDRLGGAPLRHRRGCAAVTPAQAGPGRLDDPQQATGRARCRPPTTTSRRGSRGCRSRRISRGSDPTSTATRSWNCSTSRRVHWSVRRGGI